MSVAKSVKSTKNNDSDDQLVFVTNEIALANRKALLDEYDILCDNHQYIQKQEYVSQHYQNLRRDFRGIPGFGKVYNNQTV